MYAKGLIDIIIIVDKEVVVIIIIVVTDIVVIIIVVVTEILVSNGDTTKNEWKQSFALEIK